MSVSRATLTTMAILNPYVNLRGQAREALDFYAAALGGDVNAMTFGQFGMEGEAADLVMHGQLETDAGFTLMVSDLPPGMAGGEPGGNVTISLSGDEEAMLRGYWEALTAGGTVHTALERQMWGDTFGDFTDRFGVRWLVNIAGGGASEA